MQQYPGFNGQIHDIRLNLQKGAFIEELNSNNIPLLNIPKAESLNVAKLITGNVVKFKSTEGVKDEKVVGLIGGGKKVFPEEYSLSGCFKYVIPKEEVK